LTVNKEYGIPRLMARPLTLPELIQVRLPPGTLARVDVARGPDKARKDWIRELILREVAKTAGSIKRSALT
jgi:hypothetical protein